MVAAFGATIILRWIFQIEFITRLIPYSVDIALNTPMMLTAAGICCMCLPYQPQQSRALTVVIRLCIGFLLLWPALTMIEHLFDVSLGIDFMRVPTLPTEAIPHPGRMAPNTCLAFLCVGTAFLLGKRERQGWQRHLFTATVAGVTVLGFSALAGHFLRLETLYRVTSFNSMLPPTALAISVLGTGLVLLHQHLYGSQPQSVRDNARNITSRTIVVLTLVALGAGVAGFAVMRETLEKSLSQNLLLSVTTNGNLLTNILADRLAIHKTIADRPVVIAPFAALMRNPHDQATRARLRQLAKNLLGVGPSGVRLLDASGAEVGVAGNLLRPKVRFEHPLQVSGQQAWLLWENGYLLHSVTPVLDEGKIVGSVFVEQRLPALDKLLQDIRASGPATDVLVCGRQGDHAFCAPNRYYADPLLTPMFRADGTPARQITHALLGETGVASAKDLRRVPVLAAYTPLQPFGLALLIKLDADDLYAPLRGRMELLVLVLAAMVVIGTLALRLQVRPLLRNLVHEQKRSQLAEQHLADSERRLRAIADNMPALISYIDHEQIFRFCNKTYQDWMGLAQAQLTGTSMRQAFGDAVYETRRAHIDKALSGERVEFEAESSLQDKTRFLHIVYIPDFHNDGKVNGFYALATDVTEAKTLEQQMSRLARFDTLTGLPNRYQFNEKLAEAIARCQRTLSPMALMFLDIDHFKAINDTLGHAAGDAVLREFSIRLSASVRGTDTVARLAGDEFVVILEQLRNADEAQLVANKILTAVAKPFFINDAPLQVGTSIGIAYFNGDIGIHAADLMERADRALYRAKEAGRHTYRLAE